MSMELEKHVVISLAFALDHFTWGVIVASGCLFTLYCSSIISYAAYVDAELLDIYINEVVIFDFKVVKVKAGLVLPIFQLMVLILLICSFILFFLGISGTSEAFFEHFEFVLDQDMNRISRTPSSISQFRIDNYSGLE